MTEKEIWNKLRVAWHGKVHMTRIENSASFGTPDVACCYNGVNFWVELKINKSGYIYFQPSQIAWITHQQNVGKGNIAILVGNEVGSFYVFNSRDIIDPVIIESKSGKPVIKLLNLSSGMLQHYYIAYVLDEILKFT